MFEVGQLVECVDDEPAQLPVIGFWDYPIKKGAIYTIRAIGIRSWMDDSPCIRLVEFVDQHNNDAFWERRFRPLRKTSIEWAREIVANPKKKIRVSA